MNILIFVSNSLFFKPEFLNAILPSLGEEVRAIIAAPVKGKKTSLYVHLKRHYTMFGFVGSIKIVWKYFQKVIVLLLGTLFGKPVSIRQIARHFNTPLHVTNDIHSPETIDYIREAKPDLIISSFAQIIKPSILSIPTIGILNKHSGFLPRYRGIYPVFWALLNGESEIGVTVHFMAQKVDAGPIICEESISVLPQDTFYTLFERAQNASADLMLRAVELIKKGERGRPMEASAIKKSYSYPKREDVKEFRKKGLRMI
jgi:methionyl-tRNA formyltransferase